MHKLTKSVKTKEQDFREVLHGVIVHDPYRWMERDTKELSSWIKQENRMTESVLSRLSMRKKLAKRIKKLLDVNTIGAPVPRQGLYFIMQRKKGQDLGVLYVSKGLHGKKRALIDQNKLSKGKTAVVRRWTPSRDGKLLAYAISEQSNDQNAIYVMDVMTGKKLKDCIPADRYPAMHSGITWNPDSTGFWYAQRMEDAPKSEEKLHSKLYYHKIGDDARNDQMIFGKDVNKDVGLATSISIDGRWLLVTATTSTGKIRRNDLYLKDLRDPGSKFVSIVKDRDALFHAWMHRGILYIMTNNHAPNWKLMTVPLERATKGMKRWKTLIPESSHVLNDVLMIRDRMFVETLENVHSILTMRNLSGKLISEIKLPPLGSLQGFWGEKEGDEVIIGFASFTMPYRVYRFDLKSNHLSLFDETKVTVDIKKLASGQVWFTSKDGTKIPMFLIYQKGMKRNGQNPVYLDGYGGFGISRTPGFGSLRAAFLELGGIYAMPCLRGGGEFGHEWHLAGTQGKKQNVFDDFAAAAEWLIKNKYTNHDRIAAFGWSNGGLLTSATMIQHPDLFKAVIVGAPVADMLRFHKFHGGRHWIADYGNPDDPKAFRYLKKYSPYHNLKSGIKYPATLVVTAEGDDRVHPMHAYKFAARLQKENGSDNPILLRVEGKAGHGGAASISKTVQQYADIYGFVAWQLGIKK